MSLLDTGFVDHALALLGDEAAKIVFRSTLGKVGAMLSNAWKSRQAKAEASGDPDTVRLVLERSQRVLDAAGGEILSEIDAGKFDAATTSREASEPATRVFVDRALEAAVTSTSEAKQLLLGRLIAQRLQTTTDTIDDIALRRAVEVVGSITEHQLLLLAANVLVRYRLYALRKVDSRDAAELALRERFAAVANRLYAAGAWSVGDFESLSSLGVIRIAEGPGERVQHLRGPDAIDDWISRNEIGQFDGIEGEVGTQDSHARFAARFPTTMTLKAVAANHIDSVAQAIVHGWRTDAVHLSPVGLRLGEIVLDQLLAAGAAVAP
jgi:hypothetical protein